jgi:nucleoside-diphosphate-sugar epimerase
MGARPIRNGKDMSVLILGCGFSGQAIARHFASTGRVVYGTTRSRTKFAAIEASGAIPLLFEGSLSKELLAAMAETAHCVLSISPDHGGDPALAALGPNLRHLLPKLGFGTYLSTVGVYGDHDGAWVDEETPCKPVSGRSVARLDAEKSWTDVFAAAGIPLAILRLSGIYGPGRNQIRTAIEGGARRLVKQGQVFNRIRVEDIAGATGFLASNGLAGIFNVTDNEPAPPQDVVAYACQTAGVALPPEQDFDTAVLTPMARSFYGENKRVSNRRISEAGYRFRFPDYRMSLDQLWQSGSWDNRAGESGD